MPEGHTVHRIALDQQELVGEELTVSSPQGRFAGGAGILDGHRLDGVEAKGKHLFHHFGEAGHLHVHLGMQGKFLRDTTGRRPLAQARVRLEVADGRPLAWELVAPSTCEVLDADGLERVFDGLGPDPLRPDADAGDARRRLADDRRSIAEVLLDQSVVSGVGNVFRAEALLACGIHPRLPACSLPAADLDCLWETLRAMMAAAVRDGRIITVPVPAGTDRAALPEDEARFVYRQGRCRRCGGPVVAEQLGGRTIHYCPADQPERRAEVAGTGTAPGGD